MLQSRKQGVPARLQLHLAPTSQTSPPLPLLPPPVRRGSSVHAASFLPAARPRKQQSPAVLWRWVQQPRRSWSSSISSTCLIPSSSLSPSRLLARGPIARFFLSPCPILLVNNTMFIATKLCFMCVCVWRPVEKASPLLLLHCCLWLPPQAGLCLWYAARRRGGRRGRGARLEERECCEPISKRAAG